MDNHWRNTMKVPRFFFMDARAALPILLVLVHARLWTFVLAVVVTLVFVWVEKRDLSFSAALRALRLILVGRKRPGLVRTVRRRFTDYSGN